jgi:dolichol-phosphate mannosyltransferase
MSTLEASNGTPVDGVSIVIPVFNEEQVIGDLVAEITAVMPVQFEYEVVVVDDGSTDGTDALLVRTMRSSDARLRVLRHRERSGQSAALRTGIEAARFPWIVTLDGDGQNDPSDIIRIVAALGQAQHAGLGMICGHRRRRQDSWLRRLSSRIANGVRRRLLRDQILDTGCGLKVFRRDLFLRLPWFDHMHRFLPALMQREGVEVIAMDVNHRPRVRGRSKYGVHNRLWAGIVDLLGVMWLQRRAKAVVSEEVK